MPAGFKRSRALWDETKNGGIPAWINAICYELQPMRLSKSSKEEALATLLSLVHFTFSVIKGILPLCKSILSFISQLSLRHWMVVGVIFGYYWLVRWIHEALDAGPVVLILTALTLIFTVGLSDDENRDGLSAYSVFNKGFEQLLGSVNADSLLAQYVGGGLAMNANQRFDAPDHQPNREIAAPPNRARHEEDVNNGGIMNEDEVNDDDERQNENNRNNRARKSGKKARRRNLDQRRELRRQREAAMQMALDGEHDVVDEVEMQRIIEEQIAAENRQR